MKVQAFPIIAVVAALLPVVNCAPAEKNDTAEDRSCRKRDEEAKTEKGPVLGCNYYCHPYDGDDYYVKKYYPDGVPCKYSDSLTSKCKNNECPYPGNADKQDNEKKDKPDEEENDNEGGQSDKGEGKENEEGGPGEVSTEGNEEGKEKPKEDGNEAEQEENKEDEPKEEEKKENEKKEEQEGEEEEEEEGELSTDAGDTAGTK